MHVLPSSHFHGVSYINLLPGGDVDVHATIIAAYIGCDAEVKVVLIQKAITFPNGAAPE